MSLTEFCRPLLGGLTVLFLAINAQHVRADMIVQWRLLDNVGVTVSEPAVFEAPGVSALLMTTGAGLNNEGALARWDTSGWGSEDADDFYSFGFTVDPGLEVTLDNLQIRTLSEASGPGTIGLFYSVDGFASQLHVFNQNPNVTLFSEVNLGGLGPLTGNVEFRLLEIGNTRADGLGATSDSARFSVGDFFPTNPDGSFAPPGVFFNGTISSIAVPEPSIGIAAMLGLSMLLARRRRA